VEIHAQGDESVSVNETTMFQLKHDHAAGELNDVTGFIESIPNDLLVTLDRFHALSLALNSTVHILDH
jgi:hypothetical protein